MSPYPTEIINYFFDKEGHNTKGCTIIHKRKIHKLIPIKSFLYTIYINQIAHNYSIDEIEYIKLWLDENTKYPYKIVLPPKNNKIKRDYSRILFLSIHDSSLFKLYWL